MFAGDRLQALDQLSEAHRHAVDADGGAALELDLDVRGPGRRLVEAPRDLEQRLVRLRASHRRRGGRWCGPRGCRRCDWPRVASPACAMKPVSSAHAISFSVGLSVEIGCARRRRSRPIAPCATCAAFSIAAICTSVFAIERTRQRGRHRIARVRQGAGLERRQHDVAREFLARVDHVRARGAGRSACVADLVHVARLPEIERDRDDFSAMPIREPRNGGGRARAARIRKHDDRFQLARSLSCLTTACALLASRAMIRMVSSPASVPATSGSRDRSMASAQQLRLSRAGLEHDELLDRLDVHEILRQRAAERLERAGRARSTRRRPADTRRPTIA